MYSEKKCPECGGTEFGKGKWSNYATLSVVGRLFAGSTVTVDVCVKCGLITSLRADKPEKFRST